MPGTNKRQIQEYAYLCVKELGMGKEEHAIW